MKSLLITKPEGKTTCSLWRQFYAGRGRGEKTYIGSVNSNVNPAELPVGITLRPGVEELTDEDLEQVRVFLRVHGTHGQPPKLKPEVMAQVRGIVRKELEAEMSASRPDPLAAAVQALADGSDFVEREATRLRQAGHWLSPGMLSSVACEASAASTKLDVLKVNSNQVRLAVQRFESALKAAGLMKTVKRSKTKLS